MAKNNSPVLTNYYEDDDIAPTSLPFPFYHPDVSLSVNVLSRGTAEADKITTTQLPLTAEVFLLPIKKYIPYFEARGFREYQVQKSVSKTMPRSQTRSPVQLYFTNKQAIAMRKAFLALSRGENSVQGDREANDFLFETGFNNLKNPPIFTLKTVNGFKILITSLIGEENLSRNEEEREEYHKKRIILERFGEDYTTRPRYSGTIFVVDAVLPLEQAIQINEFANAASTILDNVSNFFRHKGRRPPQMYDLRHLGGYPLAVTINKEGPRLFPMSAGDWAYDKNMKPVYSYTAFNEAPRDDSDVGVPIFRNRFYHQGKTYEGHGWHGLFSCGWPLNSETKKLMPDFDKRIKAALG